MTAPIDIFSDVLRTLGSLGAAESAPSAEDTEVCRRGLNRMLGNLNTRRRNAAYIREQSFPFTVARDSYTIGPTGNFVVSAGGRPVRIETAKMVNTSVSPYSEYLMPVINQDQYKRIEVPAMVGSFPSTLYYQPTPTNGTLRIYPAYPTERTFQLKLSWWDQFLTVAAGAESTDVAMPDGQEAAIMWNLCVEMYPLFPKKSDIAFIIDRAGKMLADWQSLNVAPPVVSANDGMNRSGGSGFNVFTGNYS